MASLHDILKTTRAVSESIANKAIEVDAKQRAMAERKIEANRRVLDHFDDKRVHNEFKNSDDMARRIASARILEERGYGKKK